MGGMLKSVALGCAGLALGIFSPALAADLQRPDTSQASTHAKLWYAHNSGWFVETPRHLLVFDFVGTGMQDTVSSLLARLLKARESGEQRVVVFVTHEHDDHYSPAIYKWQKRIPSITYVLGLQTAKAGNRVLLVPRADTVVVDSMRIRTIRSTELGLGFLVNVDGLVIFHAGDHAQWEEKDRAAYQREIDWLAALGERIDIAFLPIAAVYDPHIRFAEPYACDAREEIKAGTSYALLKLQPAVAFPMHVRCLDQLRLYRVFAESMRIFAGRGTLLYAERLGEGFDYNQRERRTVRLTGRRD